jgi:hypothetical protein
VPKGTWTDIALMVYRNVNPSSPIDVSAGHDAGVTAAPATPSVTTRFPNERLVAVFVGLDYRTWIASSGMTQRLAFDSVTAQEIIQPAAGASGTKEAATASATRVSAQIIALRGR